MPLTLRLATAATVVAVASLALASCGRPSSSPETPAWRLADNSPVKPDAALLTQMTAALDAAAHSGTNPSISKFQVKAATAFDYDGHQQVVMGGNTEYELPEAIHGEASTVNHVIARFGPEVARDKIQFVAFYSATCGGDSRGCGDCRDYMVASTQYDRLLWVCGSAKDHTMVVRRFADGLVAEQAFPDVTPANAGIPAPDLQRLTKAAQQALRHGILLFTTQEQHSAAAVLTTKGTIYQAAGADDAAFHYRYPIGGALQQAATAGEYAVRAVLVAGKEGTWPHVMYRDRQYGFEYSSFGQARGQAPIRLILTNGQGAFKATTFEDALPHPFSVSRFNPAAIERFLATQEQAPHP